MKHKVAVLCGFGINCDYETAHAAQAAGMDASRVHLTDLMERPGIMDDYHMLVFPGGFSYGDDLGSGRVVANRFRHRAGEKISQFVKDGKLVLGICNGFQIILKMGLLPYGDFDQKATLASNESGKFEDRWVHLRTVQGTKCIFTKDIGGIMLPVRHGEGKFVADAAVLDDLDAKGMVALRYSDAAGNGQPAYPFNPNGSMRAIAGICNETGTVFGLMPHPEAYNTLMNNPYWQVVKGGTRDWRGPGLKMFDNAAAYLAEKF
jgi:phosphoribosylformylglycinamidine synthase subunit PurQ / glutaminase